MVVGRIVLCHSEIDSREKKLYVCMCTGSWSWKFYRARIAAVNNDGTYRVRFDDGDVGDNIPERYIRRVFDTNDYELHEIHKSVHGFTHVDVQEDDGSWVPIDIYRSNNCENGVILSFGKGKFEGLTGGYTLIDGKLRDADGDEIKYKIPAPVKNETNWNKSCVKYEQEAQSNGRAVSGYKPSATQSIKQTSRASPRKNAVAINERIEYLFAINGQRSWFSGIVRNKTRFRDWFKVTIF